MNGIKSDTTWLGALLNSAATRHRAVATNLANANTPGYRPVRVKFEEMLRETLRRSGRFDGKSIAAIRPKITVERPGVGGSQGVVVEDEVMTMMKNQLAYDTYAQVLSMKVEMLRSAITSRGGR